MRLCRRRIIDALTSPFWHLAWRLKGLHRCTRCGLTWEPQAVMDRQGGVCHDCEGDDIVRDMDWQERTRYREALMRIADLPEHQLAVLPPAAIQNIAKDALNA